MIRNIRNHDRNRKQNFRKTFAALLCFAAAFLAGRAAASGMAEIRSASGSSENTGTEVTSGDGKREMSEEENAAAEAAQRAVIRAATEGSWGLSFQQEGQPPVANATREELAQYDAFYSQDTQEKIIYLTFDCGYENGNTPAILAALKKHQVPATFFVVGNFVSDNPELVKQMFAEGHTVGNHTAHHPDMSAISDLESFQQELEELEQLVRDATGQEVSKYYRPPQGKYSENNLKMAQQLGYKTFFWSLAYVDWYEDQQPTKEEAFEKLLKRIHPGAVVLLHNTSATNGAILDELLTKWEEMGYRFGRLEDLIAEI
jgi:peptidoglycan-N-acetylmuramic acid deacetylase